MTARTEFGDGGDAPVEDLAEPLLGWRSWTLATPLVGMRGREDATLVSNFTGEPWPVGGLRARCLCRFWGCRCGLCYRAVGACDPVPGPPSPVEAVSPGYGCGIYAFRSYGEFSRSRWSKSVQVTGAVYLGGRVWPHERGYRAEHARVAYLVNAGTTARSALLRELARRYGVPLLATREARQLDG